MNSKTHFLALRRDKNRCDFGNVTSHNSKGMKAFLYDAFLSLSLSLSHTQRIIIKNTYKYKKQ